LALVSKKAAPTDAANSAPFAALIALFSSRSHLFPERKTNAGWVIPY